MRRTCWEFTAADQLSPGILSSRATTHPATRRVPPLRSRPGRSWRSPPREDPPGRKTIPRRRSILPRTRRARRVPPTRRLRDASRPRPRGGPDATPGRTSRPCGARAVGQRARVPSGAPRRHREEIANARFEKECPAVPNSQSCPSAKSKKIADFFDTKQLGTQEAPSPKRKSPLMTSCLSLYSARANRSRRSDSKHG